MLGISLIYYTYSGLSKKSLGLSYSLRKSVSAVVFLVLF